MMHERCHKHPDREAYGTLIQNKDGRELGLCRECFDNEIEPEEEYDAEAATSVDGGGL